MTKKHTLIQYPPIYELKFINRGVLILQTDITLFYH